MLHVKQEHRQRLLKVDEKKRHRIKEESLEKHEECWKIRSCQLRDRDQARIG